MVSVEAVDWPDGCLGVQTPGVMCTMVITPGYRVILEADGKQYEYHTNASGDVVRLAAVTPQRLNARRADLDRGRLVLCLKIKL